MKVYLVLVDDAHLAENLVLNWLADDARVFSTEKKAARYVQKMKELFATQPDSPQILARIVEKELDDGDNDHLQEVVIGSCAVKVTPSTQPCIGPLSLAKSLRVGTAFPLRLRTTYTSRLGLSATLILEALTGQEIYDYLLAHHGIPVTVPATFGLGDR
jgi:hypothetical protein